MDDTTNQVAALLELDKSSGKLVPSETFQGYIEFVPSPEVRERMDAYMSSQLAQTLCDYAPIFQEAKENIETYKAQKMVLDGGETILPSPLARIAADQIIAWAYNTVLRPRPILSIDPFFPQTYDVTFPVEMPGPNGEVVTVPSVVPRDAEKVAATWELGYEFILRERLNFPRKLHQILTDCVTGASPCWVKVCYNYETRPVFQPTKSGVFVDLSDKRETEVPVGDPVKWHILPVFNVIRPLDEHDVQASPWIAEHCPYTPDDFLLNYYRGEYPLIKDDDEATKLSQVVTTEAPSKDAKDVAQRAAAANPRPRVDVWLVWLYWDVKIVVEGRKTIKRLSLMGYYHAGANRFISLFRNPYDHQLRPYVPCFQIRDPHTLSGASTVGVVKYHQRVKTQLLSLEIQNAAAANNLSFFADPDTEAYEALKAAKKLDPFEVIPKREDEYVEKWRKGENHYSLLPLVQYTDNDGMRAANVSGYETGENIPGRTPAATVSQILAQGTQQPIMFLRTLADALTDAIKIDLRTRRQYYPMGETFHVRDPETQQLLEVLFQFPVEDAIDNFRFALTAADEALAQEHELPQLMALQKLNQERANFVAQVAAPMSNPAMTPAQVGLLQRILESDQAIADKIIGLTRTDTKRFDYTEAIASIVQERNAAMMAAQMAAQKGMTSGNPNAIPGEVPPGPEGPGNAGGPSGPSGQPPLPAGGPPNPAGGIPAEAVQFV